MPNEYLQPCPLSWVHQVLKSKIDRGERFTEQDAAQSLLLDRLRDVKRSKSSYARLWSWPRSTLYDRWDDIDKQAKRQRTFYAEDKTTDRHPTDTPSDTDRHPVGQKTASHGDEEGKSDTRSDTDRHPTDTLPTPYITDSLDNTDKKKKSVGGARAREEPGSDLPRPLSDITADEIYKHVTGHANPGIQAIDWMRQVVDGGRSRDGPLPGDTELRRGFWEMIVRTWADSETRNERQPSKLLNDFTTQLREHYADQSRERPEDIPDDPTENRLRILRAAARGAGVAQ